MIDTDKYEGLNEVINRIINSDEIGIDDLLADSMAVKKSINELLAEVKRLRELVDNLYDFTKQMQRMGQKDPIGLEVLKDRMYWRNEE